MIRFILTIGFISFLLLLYKLTQTDMINAILAWNMRVKLPWGIVVE